MARSVEIAESRLSALSRAHELILPRHDGDVTRRVDLCELVKLVLSLYDHGDTRITVCGPDVECGSSMSTSMALLMHEFATNSIKYGALADPEGKLTIQWALNAEAVTLLWAEIATGHSKERPTPGFGSFLGRGNHPKSRS